MESKPYYRRGDEDLDLGPLLKRSGILVIDTLPETGSNAGSSISYDPGFSVLDPLDADLSEFVDSILKGSRSVISGEVINRPRKVTIPRTAGMIAFEDIFAQLQLNDETLKVEPVKLPLLSPGMPVTELHLKKAKKLVQDAYKEIFSGEKDHDVIIHAAINTTPDGSKFGKVSTVAAAEIYAMQHLIQILKAQKRLPCNVLTVVVVKSHHPQTEIGNYFARLLSEQDGEENVARIDTRRFNAERLAEFFSTEQADVPEDQREALQAVSAEHPVVQKIVADYAGDANVAAQIRRLSRVSHVLKEMNPEQSSGDPLEIALDYYESLRSKALFSEPPRGIVRGD